MCSEWVATVVTASGKHGRNELSTLVSVGIQSRGSLGSCWAVPCIKLFILSCRQSGLSHPGVACVYMNIDDVYADPRQSFGDLGG